MIIQSALTLAPLRISLIGGGTDFESYYSKFDGMVISAAIQKYVYVHIKRHDPLFQEKYRISYSSVEHCQSRNEIQNSIVRSSLELLGMDEPLQISISSDLPSNSGLGSSSSFTVALLLGLHSLKGEQISASQLAKEACQVEIEIMKSPIGKQDQYAAAFGGFNCYEFLSNSRVRIEPIDISKSKSDVLFNNSMIIWTGKSRNANDILSDQENRIKDNFIHLNDIKELANQFRIELMREQSDPNKLGQLISKSWELKRKLSPLIYDDSISSIITKLNSLNCLGFKLLCAGGGGFVYSMFDDIDDHLIRQMKNLTYFIPEIDNKGARVVSVN
jgi:D-glycero-alpha-D-manno-heptose-7-phosphate kinase